jgi:hypothetical protein
MDFEPIALCGPDEKGMLLLTNGRVAGILVQLSEIHGDLAGQWFLEAGLGPLEGRGRKLFPDLATARSSLVERVNPNSG